jgi:type IV secretion system protein VirB9
MSRNINYIIIIFSILLISLRFEANALRLSRALPYDKRLHVVVYNPHDVFLFKGFYGYQSSIVFSDQETVESITMGDSIAWQVVPTGNRIFIKPMEPEATTNMAVITTKRVYHFELHAENANDINDPEMVFSVKFLYPGDDELLQMQTADNAEPDLTDKSKYHFNYTISGPSKFAPVKIFDDGNFTYFEFKEKNAELPAFFSVNSDATESMINYRILGKYIVIERVAQKLTLRNGSDVICVFRESGPIDKS